jgi:hypothetical protein
MAKRYCKICLTEFNITKARRLFCSNVCAEKGLAERKIRERELDRIRSNKRYHANPEKYRTFQRNYYERHIGRRKEIADKQRRKVRQGMAALEVLAKLGVNIGGDDA